MKKMMAMMMAMAMAFSVAACGGGEEAPAAPTLVEKQFGEYVTMMIPDDCQDMVEQEGMVGIPGPGYSVVVSDPYEEELLAADVTEELALELVAAEKENAKIVDFQNPVEVDGTEAVIFTVDEGNGNTQTFVILYYMLDDVMQQQMICYTYTTDGDTTLKTSLDEVIGSIKIG